ncbi:MAG TPA: hypothetical protein DIW47_02380 [Bacteroidetes bacterium]|nr:hypothetical protein [Bacteroidota bacterium]
MHPLAQLQPDLFWDINLTGLDWNKHKQLIVERVLERGSYKTFRITEEHYGKEVLKNIIRKISYMHPRDISFVKIYFQLQTEDLRCCSTVGP